MQTASLGATCGFPGSIHCLMFLEVIKTQSELQNIFGFLGHVIYLKCGKSVGGRWNSPEMASFWHMEDSDSDISQVHGLLQICSSWNNLTVLKEEKGMSVPFPSCQLVILFCCTSRELKEEVSTWISWGNTAVFYGRSIVHEALIDTSWSGLALWMRLGPQSLRMLIQHFLLALYWPV